MTANQVAWQKNVQEAAKTAEAKRHNEAMEIIADKEARIAQQRADTEATRAKVENRATTISTLSNALLNRTRRIKESVGAIGSIFKSL